MFISQKSAQRIADELRSVIDREINIIDRDGLIIASTDSARIGTLHSGAKRLIDKHLDELAVYSDDREAGIKAGINLPISINGAIEGVIGVTGRPEEMLIPAGVIKKMTELMILDLRRQEETIEEENRKRLFYEYWLMAETPDMRELEYRAGLVGIDLNELRAAAVFSGGNEKRAECIGTLAAGLKDGFSFEFRDGTVLIFSGRDRVQISSELERICGLAETECGELHCGASIKKNKSMAECYKEALEALRVAVRAKRRCMMFDEASLGFVLKALPKGAVDKLRARLFSSCTEAEQRELMSTVRLYFEYGGDADKMADAVFVHRNTIYYRMKQVKRLTGCSLSIPEESFLLYIACME